MKQALVITLAASALAPVPALAQPRTVEPPVKWEDVPHAQVRMPHGSGPHVMPNAAPRGEMRRIEIRRAPGHAAAPPVVMHHGPVQAHGAFDRTIVRYHRGGHGAWRGHRGVRNYSHYRRFNRGFVLPQAWWGPRFHIQNWSTYGLPAPVHGGRWVRYYDDALMIDGHGRIHDGRWGMTWDDWQDQWAYDDRGVPVYVGEGDFHPGERDYAWAEGHGDYADERGYSGGYAHGGGYAPPPPPCAQGCAMPPPPPYGYGYGHGYGQGWGYGAGWGYGGAVVVTETTVTTSPTIVTETWIEEEVVQERRAKPRKQRAKPRYYAPKPKPKPRPYVERG